MNTFYLPSSGRVYYANQIHQNTGFAPPWQTPAFSLLAVSTP